MSGTTRQTFAGLAHWEIVFWYVLIVVSTSVFFFGVARLVLKYRRGRPGPIDRGPIQWRGAGRRAARTVAIVFTHRWIKRRDHSRGSVTR